MTKSDLLIAAQQAADGDLASWAIDAAGPRAAEDLSWRAAHAYVAAWPDNDLLEFPFNGAMYWFDSRESKEARESRTVAGCGPVPPAVAERDKSRQRGYPLASRLAAAGFERGHLIGRASGGGMDVNLFPQAWQVNRGRSLEGKEYRRLERVGAANPGALVMTRLIYLDETAVPGRVHLLVAVPGKDVVQGLFGNQPEPRRPAVRPS